MARVVVVIKSKGKKHAVALAYELLRKQGSLQIGEVALSWQAGPELGARQRSHQKGQGCGQCRGATRGRMASCRTSPMK